MEKYPAYDDKVPSWPGPGHQALRPAWLSLGFLKCTCTKDACINKCISHRLDIALIYKINHEINQVHITVKHIFILSQRFSSSLSFFCEWELAIPFLCLLPPLPSSLMLLLSELPPQIPPMVFSIPASTV